MIMPSDEELIIKLASKKNASIVIDGYTDDEIEENLEITISQKDLSYELCLLYTSPSPRDISRSRMPSSA